MHKLSREQIAFTYICTVEPMVRFARDSLLDTELDDLELISDLDKARLCIKCAINRMEELIKKSQEPKSVCY
jgi:hypothetical protein